MSRIKITFMADKEDREYLRILAAKADCSQGELLLKLMHGYGETLVRVMREEERLQELKSGAFTGVQNELEDLSVGYR